MKKSLYAISLSYDNEKYKVGINPVHDVDRFDMNYIAAGTTVTITIDKIYHSNTEPDITFKKLNVDQKYHELPFKIQRLLNERFEIQFTMPHDSIKAIISDKSYNDDQKSSYIPNVIAYNNGIVKEEETKMESKLEEAVDQFEIPEELAKELSNLLTKQVIKERLLVQLVTDQSKYDAVENALIPVVAKIEAIKAKITKEYVPAKYNSELFRWSYDGYEVDGNKVSIIKVGN